MRPTAATRRQRLLVQITHVWPPVGRTAGMQMKPRHRPPPPAIHDITPADKSASYLARIARPRSQRQPRRPYIHPSPALFRHSQRHPAHRSVSRTSAHQRRTLRRRAKSPSRAPGSAKTVLPDPPNQNPKPAPRRTLPKASSRTRPRAHQPLPPASSPARQPASPPAPNAPTEKKKKKKLKKTE
jgi:hypothetical protein